jgi:hypothetical protein
MSIASGMSTPASMILEPATELVAEDPRAMPAKDSEDFIAQRCASCGLEECQQTCCCSSGHTLQESATPEAKPQCDRCGRAQVMGVTMFSCRRCNFDVCRKCYQAAEKGEGGCLGDPGTEWEGQWFCGDCWTSWADEQCAQFAEKSTEAASEIGMLEFYDGDVDAHDTFVEWGDWSESDDPEPSPQSDGCSESILPWGLSPRTLRNRCAELGSDDHLEAALQLCRQEEAPRIIWTYWDQGHEKVPPFNALCIETWQSTNPEWQVVVLDHQTLKGCLEPGDLPPAFDSPGMLCQHRADCARLALLRRFGGIYMDSSVMALRDVPNALDWAKIESGHKDFAGFFLRDRAYVENYILACRRGSPLVCSWHRVWLEFWHSRQGFTQFFNGIDLSHIPSWNHEYLVQHACYKKLLDLDTGGFRGLAKRAHLLDAASRRGALWLFRRLREEALVLLQGGAGPEPGEEVPDDVLGGCMANRLLDGMDAALVEDVISSGLPVAKFTGTIGRFLEQETWEGLLGRRSTLRSLFEAAMLEC